MGKQQVHIAGKRARPTEPAGTLCERFHVFRGWSWDEVKNRGRRYGESYEEMARNCDVKSIRSRQTTTKARCG